MYLSLTSTLIALAITAGIFAFSAWETRKPARPEKGPRLIPWTLIAITAGAFFVVFIAHLATLFGIDLPARRSF